MTSNLTVLGCGNAFGAGGRGQTAFFWRTPDAGILIDCGATTLPAMQAHGLDTDDVDAIVLSHFHGDHIGGLPFFILKAAIYGRSKPLTIFSPPGCEEKLRAGLGLYFAGNEDSLDKVAPAFIAFEGRQTVAGAGLRIESFPMIHSPGSLPHGVRIHAGGRVLAYSGDTEWTDELIPLADGADLLICECSFYEMQVKNHLSYTTLRTHLPELRCKRILLTHLDDEMLAVADALPQPCAHDGLVLTV